MPQSIKQFNGFLNTDDSLEVIPSPHHKMARNVRFRGNGTNLRVENIVGTTEITYTKPSGTNQCIGSYYDGLRQRIYFFNYNSNGNHGIYYYNINTNTVTPLLVCGTNSTGDILGFDLDHFIASINILYTTEGEGDVLHWVQRNSEAKRLNIKEAEDNIYGANWLAKYLTVIKAPPVMPPKVVYENDTNVKINNLRNSLFQFSYRFVYSNNEKSVWSSRSIVPLPNQSNLNLTADTFTNNSRIGIIMSSGDASVNKIELAFRQTKNGATSDWFLVDSFDKTTLSISDNDVYSFRFYNDGIYLPIDTDEIGQLQDYIPREPKAQELLNGNVLALGGGIEGFDYLNPTLTVNTATDTSNFFYDYNGLLFLCVASGLDSGVTATQLKIYVLGTGTNTSGTVTTLNNAAAYFAINAVNAAGTQIGITYTNTTDTVTVASLLAAISAALVTNGWSSSSISGNVLTISYVGGFTLQSSGTKLYLNSVNNNTTSFAMPFEAAAQVGIQYFDAYGRTAGTFTNANAIFNTPQSNTLNYSQPKVTIAHRPPLTAAYYQLVRINNSTYQKRLTWISQAAYATGLVASPSIRYAFLGISNISDYNTSIEATQGVVGYSFAQGDRVRISKRYDVTGAVTNLTIVDYEILGVEVNPIIDSVVKEGSFLKIAYPTNDISADFKFDGSVDFLHYEMLIYSYKEHSVGNQNIFFEFGRCFGIGNAGTSNAYHMGLDQTQTADLVTPAIVSITNGDLFFRKRNVIYGENYVFQSNNSQQDIDSTLSIYVETAVDNASYKIQSLPETPSNSTNPAIYPTWADDAFFYNKGATFDKSKIVRMKFDLSVTNGDTTPATFGFGYVICSALVPFSPKYYTPVTAQTITILPQETKIVPIDITISVPPTGKLFPILLSNTNSIGDTFFKNTTNMQFDVLNSSNINIIESSFSDVYKLETNSNGRESISDINSKQLKNPVLVRWSLPYVANTNVNQSNTFRFTNFDEIDRKKGSIQRFKYRDRKLIVFQNLAVGRYGVYSKYIRNNSGQTELVVTDQILTQNNIQYYQGESGIGDEYTALCSSEDADYFVYPITGALIRLAGDGMTNLSDTYKGQFYLSNLINKYNRDYLRADSSKSKVMMYFDNYEEQAHTILQGGAIGADVILPYCFSFNETRNSFTSFYDYLNPDNMICAENTTYSWKDGKMYVHNNEVDYTKFWGTQYYPSIEFVFNEQEAVKKNFNAIAYQSNQIWQSATTGDIYTSYVNPQTNLLQASQLKSVDYDVDENKRIAAFLRDANSESVASSALINGDYLMGFYIVVKFSYLGASFAWMYLPYVTWKLNNRQV